MSESSFLPEPDRTALVQAMFDEDVADMGFVMNVSRLWAYQPATADLLFDLMSKAFQASGLSFRDRGLLVTATASTLGDSYCALAWGYKLATKGSAAAAVAVLRGDGRDLTAREQAMVAWARAVVHDPNSTTAADVQKLRDVGFSDSQIFSVTTFVALRLAFSTVNDALGARPDAELLTLAPTDVVEAVTYGRTSIAGKDPTGTNGFS